MSKGKSLQICIEPHMTYKNHNGQFGLTLKGSRQSGPASNVFALIIQLHECTETAPNVLGMCTTRKCYKLLRNDEEIWTVMRDAVPRGGLKGLTVKSGRDVGGKYSRCDDS
ncbi:unnamed protein product [Allacma fusca]|uniref:Uncharacterized protein n=1 Tax=Allacma fusca TaxID=39272 RepID=A0A8J2NWD4_9HEXA|nr:unnamed protein product [Allacma fusca]